MQVFSFPAVNGVYPFNVGNHADEGLVYHWLTLSLSSGSPGGFIKLEVSQLGDDTWYPVVEMGAIPISATTSVVFSAVARAYRFTVYGAVDAPSVTITAKVLDTNAWPGPMSPQGLYTGLRAVTVQSYTEANVKNGLQFEASARVLNVPAGGSVDVVMITSSKRVLVKGRQISFTGSGFTARVFRGPTYTGGVSSPIYNLTDTEPMATTVTILSGVTVSATGAEFGAPTYAFGTSSGSGNAVGTFTISGLERLLRKNTTYLLRLTNDDSSPRSIASYLTWYEGDSDLPIGIPHVL